MERSSLKELEVKVERLRSELYKKAGNDNANLSDPSLLLLSKELDALIIDYMKAKHKHLN